MLAKSSEHFVRTILNSLFVIKSLVTVSEKLFIVPAVNDEDSNIPQFVLTPILLIQVLQFHNFNENGNFLATNLKKILVTFELSIN